MNRCVIISVITDVLLLKHQGISIHSVDLVSTDILHYTKFIQNIAMTATNTINCIYKSFYKIGTVLILLTSLRRQDISSHVIDYVEYVGHGFT